MDASEYQGRKRKYFQLLFLGIKAENLDESCQNIDSAMKQICRNSAHSKRKLQVTELQREPQKILKIKKHGDVNINISRHESQTTTDIRHSKIEK